MLESQLLLYSIRTLNLNQPGNENIVSPAHDELDGMKEEYSRFDRTLFEVEYRIPESR